MTKFPCDQGDWLTSNQPQGDVAVPEYVESEPLVAIRQEAGVYGSVFPPPRPRRVTDGEYQFIADIHDALFRTFAELNFSCAATFGWTDLSSALNAGTRHVEDIVLNVSVPYGYRLPAPEARKVREQGEALVDALHQFNRSVYLFRRERERLLSAYRPRPEWLWDAGDESLAGGPVEDTREDGASEDYRSGGVPAPKQADLKVVEVRGGQCPYIEGA